MVNTPESGSVQQQEEPIMESIESIRTSIGDLSQNQDYLLANDINPPEECNSPRSPSEESNREEYEVELGMTEAISDGCLAPHSLSLSSEDNQLEQTLGVPPETSQSGNAANRGVKRSRSLSFTPPLLLSPSPPLPEEGFPIDEGDQARWSSDYLSDARQNLNDLLEPYWTENRDSKPGRFFPIQEPTSVKETRRKRSLSSFSEEEQEGRAAKRQKRSRASSSRYSTPMRTLAILNRVRRSSYEQPRGRSKTPKTLNTRP